MKKIGILISLLMLVFAAYAVEEKPGQSHAGQLALSVQTRDLLRQEMNEIKKGMESLVFSIASGDWQAIEDTGHLIKHSYLLKKRLSKQQKMELGKVLPEGFKEIDKQFHYYAGMLAHVAVERDRELVNFYFHKMNESCGSCHSKYAVDRFPGFHLNNKHEQMHGKHQH